MAEGSDRVPHTAASVCFRPGYTNVLDEGARGRNWRLAAGLCSGLLVAFNVLVAREALMVGWVPFAITILIGSAFCVPLFAVSRQIRSANQGQEQVAEIASQEIESPSRPSKNVEFFGPQLGHDVYLELEWRSQTAGFAALPADIRYQVGKLLELFAFITGEHNYKEPLRIDQALVVLRNMPTAAGYDLRIISALEAVLLGRQVQVDASDWTSDSDRHVVPHTS